MGLKLTGQLAPMFMGQEISLLVWAPRRTDMQKQQNVSASLI